MLAVFFSFINWIGNCFGQELRSGIDTEFRGVVFILVLKWLCKGIPVTAEFQVNWVGGQSGPTMDCGDFVDESEYTPSSLPIASSKIVQGGNSSSSGSASGKMMVGSGGPDSYQVVFVKDNVAVHPTQNASERISGRLRLIKQGASLFMVGTLPSYEGCH